MVYDFSALVGLMGLTCTGLICNYSFVPKLSYGFLFALAPAPLPPEMASKAPRAFEPASPCDYISHVGAMLTI